MPDVLSIGLGGGSHIRRWPHRIGPLSVGYELTNRGLVFGGQQLTCTDIAVAAGLIDLGDRSRVDALPAALVETTLRAIHGRIEDAVDRIKPDARDLPLVAVGGGAFLVPDRVAGISRVVAVPHNAVANAIGAAIAQVGGEVDQVFVDLSREEAIARAREMAEEKAVQAGAVPKTIKVVEVEDLPIAYLPGNALRTRVRVVGDIV
jgi:N-methylhydantoinase A/oxoprolinase/acetone carboxylase beta subunit